MVRGPEALGASARQYRRGVLLGMTMAEAFILVSFALLLLLAAWKTQADEEVARFRDIEEIGRDEARLVAELLESGRLAEASRIASSERYRDLLELDFWVKDLARLREIAADEESWRLIDKDELRRLLDGARELPEDLQRDLADLVEMTDAGGLVELLKATERAPEDARIRERLAGIGARIDAERRAEQAMVEDMRETLGEAVSQVGGHIYDSGSIVLPDNILFDVGSARVTSRMRDFLGTICVPWMRVMMRSPVEVSGAEIEGHASSEWRRQSSAEEAYLNNLDLSQRRSAAVLRECLSMAEEAGVREWARTHLAAVGYSSARPVLGDRGEEDQARSRRVIFSLDLDESRLLHDLEDEVDQSLSSEF